MVESLDPHLVVVGASMGGMRAAEAARKAGFRGAISVVGDEPHMPYNRPPLSKKALTGDQDLDSLIFRVPRAAADVVWKLGTRVLTADLAGRRLRTDHGETIQYDGLIVATGLRPRRLAIPGPAGGRYVIRTLEDARKVRDLLSPGVRVVIIGAGFIGCEVAAGAVGLGARVRIVAPEPVPMQRPLGDVLGLALQQRHETRGVIFHLGRLPIRFTGDNTVTGVVLDDESELAADLVVEAVGCTPNVEWLQGNGLDLTDGVRCDNLMRVQGRADLVACGDIAKFPNLLFDDVARRVEHWTMVTDTAKRAGKTIGAHLAGNEPDSTKFAPVPTFWSDQYDMRIQSFGAVGLGQHDIRVLEGSLDADVILGYHRDEVLVGVAMIGFGGNHRIYHDQIASLATRALR